VIKKLKGSLLLSHVVKQMADTGDGGKAQKQVMNQSYL